MTSRSPTVVCWQAMRGAPCRERVYVLTWNSLPRRFMEASKRCPKMPALSPSWLRLSHTASTLPDRSEHSSGVSCELIV